MVGNYTCAQAHLPAWRRQLTSLILHLKGQRLHEGYRIRFWRQDDTKGPGLSSLMFPHRWSAFTFGSGTKPGTQLMNFRISIEADLDLGKKHGVVG